ncbi:hypothetical protein AVEN_212920-1 [Araneus ventricosus]|uniref:Uncharacterized protein n=1 Tax=Araneus ventricosus TaxID=182803 RepID=A0A4Y2MHC5_ARAVE|nr:hypothetical protein AVEN_212920-1 [Araneus ventricosus]
MAVCHGTLLISRIPATKSRKVSGWETWEAMRVESIDWKQDPPQMLSAQALNWRNYMVWCSILHEDGCVLCQPRCSSGRMLFCHNTALTESAVSKHVPVTSSKKKWTD